MKKKTQRQSESMNELEATQKVMLGQQKELERLQQERREYIAAQAEQRRQEHQLEVIGLITVGKKEEAIASILRKDVILFGIEVRFANDETLEKARQEWYAKGVAACALAINNCTLTARRLEGQEKQTVGKSKENKGVS